jgi:PAS domain S-box-containing protein
VATVSKRTTQENRLASPHFLDSILENLVDCVLLIEPDGRIRKINKATLDLLGYAQEELLERNFSEILGDENLFDLITGLIEGGSLREFELTFVTKFGRNIPMSCSASALTSEKGRMQAIVCIAKDITERKEAEQALRESEERFRSLFENIPIGVYRITPDGNFLNANPALLKMIGCPENSELNTIDFEKIASDGGYSRNEFKALIEKNGEIHGLECVWRTKDGTFLYIRENAKIVRDEKGTPLYFEGTIEDISERKKLEQIKNDFISIVSHELRVPLTAIHGSLGWISEHAVELPEKIKRMIEIANRSSDRMVRLINDMLDIDKIESGKMAFYIRPLDLVPLLELSIEGNQPYAEQFKVKICLVEHAPRVKVLGDTDRVVQVMTNLLSNAAKFSPVNAIVRVAVSIRDGFARVSITDQGAGIPGQYQSRIFQKFVQVPGKEGRQKGTGLGLSISKAMVEKMNGRIGFESNSPVGTTFYFDLPLYNEV